MPPLAPTAAGPIGVFDSGIGGLTVVAALRELLPAEDIFYLGDTARVPYGGKGRQTIERYTLEIAELLLSFLVVAGNAHDVAVIRGDEIGVLVCERLAHPSRVLLIDSDLRKPAFKTATDKVGLSKLLTADEPLRGHVLETQHANLWLLPSTDIPGAGS